MKFSTATTALWVLAAIKFSLILAYSGHWFSSEPQPSSYILAHRVLTILLLQLATVQLWTLSVSATCKVVCMVPISVLGYMYLFPEFISLEQGGYVMAGTVLYSIPCLFYLFKSLKTDA